MRELTIDFNLENPLSGGCEAGYIGENNATTLIVKPGASILNTGCSSFAVVFLTHGEIYRTEQFTPASEFRIMLGAHLTQDHYLSLQIEGYSARNDVLYKSPMITKIHFMPSIQGNESEIDPKDYQIYSQIALNTQSRHSHSNTAVLNRLKAEDGTLFYNGSPVCKVPKTKTVVLSAENGDIDALMSTSGTTRMDLVSYSDIESFAVPANSEIISVELQIDSDDCPEWLDIREMVKYDAENPYILNIFKPFTDPDIQMTVFCRMYFIGNLNKIANYIAAFKLKNVRITYADSQVS